MALSRNSGWAVEETSTLALSVGKGALRAGKGGAVKGSLQVRSSFRDPWKDPLQGPLHEPWKETLLYRTL